MPVRRVTLDMEIESEGSGFHLTYRAREDESITYDNWFATLEEAERNAEEVFGVRRDQWKSA